MSDPFPDTNSWANHVILSFDSDTTYSCQMYGNYFRGFYHVKSNSNAISFSIRSLSAALDPVIFDSLLIAVIPSVVSIEMANEELKLQYGTGMQEMNFIKSKK